MIEIQQNPERPQKWGPEALALVAQAKMLPGFKLDQLVRRLQRQSGRSREECWRFVIQYGIKTEMEHRRWSEDELEQARELLAKYSVEEVAKKLKRSPRALRNYLHRQKLCVREIRCDCFSLGSLAKVLHVRRSEVRQWIGQEWLEATLTNEGKRTSYRITPEALSKLYKHHLHDLLKRRIPNHTLFEAYYQYCFSPKHTAGEQLLEVRRDKREREAFANAQEQGELFEQEEQAEDGVDS